MERPLSIQEAAQITGLSRHYIYKLVHQKKIPYYKPMGGRVYFKPEDLESFIYRNRQNADYERVSHA